MTEAAVSYLLKKTDEWLTKELSLPDNIKRGIRKLKDELEMIRAFLSDRDTSKKQNEVQVWIQQLRDIAKDIEVALDKFAYQNAQQNAPWYARIPKINSRSIANSINEIEECLKSIQERTVKFPMNFSSHLTSTSSFDEARVAPLYTPEIQMVGLEEPKKALASWALDVKNGYKVRFVVGTGGSGKTALVKLAYEELKTDFECHVWLTASRFKQGRELLSTMVNKLCNQTGQSPSTSHTLEDLIDKLNSYLQGKKYLIVLDDLQNKRVWESVTYALPRENCSRVIITTRRGDIASSYRENFVDACKVQALPPEQAEELFCRKAFPESGMYPSGSALQESCRKLLQEFEGLPLGIIEVGKLLSNREKREFELKKLHDSLQAELASGQLSGITRVLLLSYNELPHHYKYCFLYMSMFPVNYSVKRRMLIRLWIAEGFIEEVNGKILEDIGEEILKELIERDLILVTEFDFDGKPLILRCHNLWLKIALSISEAESFSTTRGGISGKTRRLSIRNSEFNVSDKTWRHAHTLLTSSLDVKIPTISSMKLLKILHLDHACADALPSGIEELLLLKYLSLRKTRIKLIPANIGRLQLLETLDLKQTLVTTLPNTVDKLEKLRHLLVCHYSISAYIAFDAVQGFKVSAEISKLTNLQKLSFIRADRGHKLIQELRKLTGLRKLGIIDLRSNSGPFLCATIQDLRNLHSLSMTAKSKDEVLDIQDIDNPPPYLQRLYLWGQLDKMPQWISRLHDLVRIRLKWSRLTHDNNPIKILGELLNLLELQLLDAYTGDQLDFDAGKFQKLRTLEFERMENLEFITVDNGALPRLQKLTISQCRRLQIPVGIDKITQLKELILSDMPPGFVDPLRTNGQMHDLVQRIGTICSRHQNGDQWTEEYLE